MINVINYAICGYFFQTNFFSIKNFFGYFYDTAKILIQLNLA